jgi:hypothetical protein
MKANFCAAPAEEAIIFRTSFGKPIREVQAD